MKKSVETISNILLGFISLLILFTMITIAALSAMAFNKSPVYTIISTLIPFIGLFLVHQMGVLTRYILEQIYPDKTNGDKQ